ncbi:hypothetical protein CP965_12300 [Halarcobacter mediterraneus]|uniref:Flagellin n=2 Tax=Arcobacteraceae TaxID=2808963 RepID=A0A4Q1AR73_9BACT|nr:flagellin [Halarcobacter mediterraneus]RXK11952.1 hypothetical protein CP965_12300 [Halarcobacter mediterraneus]
MYLNNNFSSLNNSILNQKNTNQSLSKLSSGLKINKASDNASGLAISDKLRTQASGIKQGVANANSAIAMMNIADKAIDELSKILDTIKSKAIQMNTDTTSVEGRKIIKTEILKLIDNYDNIVCRTNYNTIPLLNGCSSPLTFQVGSRDKDTVNVNINSIESRNMGDINPNKLINFITGFNTLLPSESIGNINDGVILSNNLQNTVEYSSMQDGRFMIEIPQGIKNLTLYLNEATFDDTFQVFTKSGKHIAGTASSDSSWQAGSNPENIISLNPEKFDINASYLDELSNPSIPLTYYGPYNSSDGMTNDPSYETDVIYTNKNGVSITKTIKQWEEMVVIPDVTETLVIFVNGVGSYETSAEWQNPLLKNQNEMCNCDNLILERNDESPDLKTQAKILMDVVDTSLSQLNSTRSDIAAATNQLESSVRNSLTNYTNIKNAESIIRDVDYAKESANFNKLNIINQAGSFVEVQKNETMKRVLDLLK